MVLNTLKKVVGIIVVCNSLSVVTAHAQRWSVWIRYNIESNGNDYRDLNDGNGPQLMWDHAKEEWIKFDVEPTTSIARVKQIVAQKTGIQWRCLHLYRLRIWSGIYEPTYYSNDEEMQDIGDDDDDDDVQVELKLCFTLPNGGTPTKEDLEECKKAIQAAFNKDTSAEDNVSESEAKSSSEATSSPVNTATAIAASVSAANKDQKS